VDHGLRAHKLTPPPRMKKTTNKTIALFVCGPLADPVEELYGSDGISGNLQLFKDFLDRSNPWPGAVKAVLHPYDVFDKMDYPSEEKIGEYDGLILSGAGKCSTSILIRSKGLIQGDVEGPSAYEDFVWINKLVKYVRWVGVEKPNVKIWGKGVIS
jgi:hypothetical protein